MPTSRIAPFGTVRAVSVYPAPGVLSLAVTKRSGRGLLPGLIPTAASVLGWSIRLVSGSFRPETMAQRATGPSTDSTRRYVQGMILTMIRPSLAEMSRKGWKTVPGSTTRPIGLAGSMLDPRTVNRARPPPRRRSGPSG